ncbi:hypothetical protein DYB26_011679 [Aphanomyces astaci]|uniref:Uncharacterized protein n=1 Tax=Aphanomyces astaci TaxID=112090 RepID=A0A397DQK6_APHAT|nr:hypothetical protein DYB38_012848 [Aphanomyces astaci]RHY82388.1 hypothetical protein DYB31_011510 [Aphanomyces astaci]RHZ09645.1 hypothetical protein DYB26_011679 [Aphanomyces astaci]
MEGRYNNRMKLPPHRTEKRANRWSFGDQQSDIDMAKLKTPSKKELIEENRVLRAEMQAATFMIPLVGQPETPSEPRAAVEPKFSANYTDQMIVALLEVRFGWFRDDFAGSKSNK